MKTLENSLMCSESVCYSEERLRTLIFNSRRPIELRVFNLVNDHLAKVILTNQKKNKPQRSKLAIERREDLTSVVSYVLAIMPERYEGSVDSSVYDCLDIPVTKEDSVIGNTFEGEYSLGSY